MRIGDYVQHKSHSCINGKIIDIGKYSVLIQTCKHVFHRCHYHELISLNDKKELHKIKLFWSGNNL